MGWSTFSSLLMIDAPHRASRSSIKHCVPTNNHTRLVCYMSGLVRLCIGSLSCFLSIDDTISPSLCSGLSDWST